MLAGNPRELPSVFIDTFYDVGPSQFASNKFRENTESLLQTGLRHKHPFQCKDIEIARSEIMEQQKRLQEMSLMLSQMEEEKQKLVMALDLVKHKAGFHHVSPPCHHCQWKVFIIIDPSFQLSSSPHNLLQSTQ